MPWSLSRKVSLTLVALLAGTVLAASVFGYYKFQDVMDELVRSRYSFVAFTIKRKVEDSLNLGFALRQLRQFQDIVELEKARDDQIQSVEIYNARGEILYNSDRGSIGASVPEAWLTPLVAVTPQAFSFIDEDSNVVGLPLVNNLGKVEGAVVLIYPSGYVARELGPILSRLGGEVAALFGGFAVLALILSRAALGGVSPRLVAMEAALRRAVAGEETDDTPVAAEFDGQFGDFLAKTREASEHMTLSADEVERLDRLA